MKIIEKQISDYFYAWMKKYFVDRKYLNKYSLRVMRPLKWTPTIHKTLDAI